MSSPTINHLIMNSPYEEPRTALTPPAGDAQLPFKRAAGLPGYVIASESSKSFDDPGRFIPIELVNQIGPRMKAWREKKDNPYAGVTGITRRLLATGTTANIEKGSISSFASWRQWNR